MSNSSKKKKNYQISTGRNGVLRGTEINEEILATRMVEMIRDEGLPLLGDLEIDKGFLGV